MIHHWKGLDLEIRGFNYHHDPTASGETIPSQTSNPFTCRDYKNCRETYIGYVVGKVLTWRSQILIISMIRHPQVKLYHFKPQTLKYKKFIKSFR